jgi:P-type Ca2+ transporter type 2C
MAILSIMVRKSLWMKIARLKLALRIGMLCNNSRLTRAETDKGEQWAIRGDPTEGALIVAARKSGMLKVRLEEEAPRVDEIPFSADRKYMVTFHKDPEGEIAVYMKGAPETSPELLQQRAGGWA